MAYNQDILKIHNLIMEPTRAEARGSLGGILEAATVHPRHEWRGFLAAEYKDVFITLDYSLRKSPL